MRTAHFWSERVVFLRRRMNSLSFAPSMSRLSSLVITRNFTSTPRVTCPRRLGDINMWVADFVPAYPPPPAHQLTFYITLVWPSSRTQRPWRFCRQARRWWWWGWDDTRTRGFAGSSSPAGSPRRTTPSSSTRFPAYQSPLCFPSNAQRITHKTWHAAITKPLASYIEKSHSSGQLKSRSAPTRNATTSPCPSKWLRLHA